MSVVGNIKSMSSLIDKMTESVNKLNAAVSKTGTTSTGVFKSVGGLINAVGGQQRLAQGTNSPTIMGSSLSSFSSLSPVAGKLTMALGVAQIATAGVAGAYASLMPTEGIINRAGGYYQASLRAGAGTSRKGVEAATFKALNGGLTGIGSDAMVASTLAGAGYTAGTKNYLGAVGQVGRAAKYLGMDNGTAAAAISGMQSGQTSATMYQYGITTSNPNGTMKSSTDIAKQIMNTFMPSKNGISSLTGKKITAESINTSYLKGNLKPVLEGLGLTSDQQQIILQAMVDQTNGGKPSSGAKNKNPLSPLFQMNASQTTIQAKSETAAIQGLQTAANTVTAFNKAFGDAIVSLEGYKAFLDGMSGSNAGRGIKATASGIFSGITNIVKGFIGIHGGGNPGYGSSFGKGSRGGGTPGSPVTTGSVSAKYGMTDTSGIWASTGNTHKGTDYDIPVGTPVYAVKDGTVSAQSLSSDYGQAVLVDHPDGYSTVYAHLSNKEVSPGTSVRQGQEIGKSGKSGNTTGPGLHFEVRRGLNNPVDPQELQLGGSPLGKTMGVPSSSASPSAGSTTGSVNPNAGTAGDQEFAKALLAKAGISPTASNISSLTTWMHWEGGTSNNAFNPLNTTLDMPGAGIFNSAGVKTYGSLQQGVDATYNTLTGNQADARGYSTILGDLKSNAPLSQVVSDINSSSWGTHIKGGGTPGYGASVPGSTGSGFATGSSPALSHGGKNVYIEVKFDQASESNALVFAKKVQTYLDERNNISTIGSS